MPLRDQFRNFLGNASFRADAGLGIVGSPSPDSDFWYHGTGVHTAAGPNISPGTATRLGAVFACTRVITETEGSLPATIVRERKSGTREAAKDHPAQELLIAPNPWQTGMEFVETIAVHCELRGNAYALKVPGNGRAIDQLIPLHPDRVRVYLLPNNRLRYEVTAYSTGQIDRYTQDEIVHFRGCWSYDGIMGISTVTANAEIIGVGLAQQEHRARYFRNNAIPGMALETVKMSDEAREEMVSSISAKFSGSGAFKVFAPPPGTKIQMLGLTNKDSQLIEASAATRIEICAAFRVPPHKIADLSKGTFSNIEQQNIEFATDGIRPRVVRKEQRFNRDLVDPLRAFESVSGDYFIVFNMDALYRGDMKSRYESYTQALPWMTRNEMRAAEGKNRIDGLDDPLVPVNMETVDQAELRSQSRASAASNNTQTADEGETEDALDRSGGTIDSAPEDSKNDRKALQRTRLRALATSAAGRIARREAKQLRKIGLHEFSGIEGQNWREETTALYASLEPLIVETLAISPVLAKQYADAHLSRMLQCERPAAFNWTVDDIEAEGPVELAKLALKGTEEKKVQE